MLCFAAVVRWGALYASRMHCSHAALLSIFPQFSWKAGNTFTEYSAPQLSFLLSCCDICVLRSPLTTIACAVRLITWFLVSEDFNSCSTEDKNLGMELLSFSFYWICCLILITCIIFKENYIFCIQLVILVDKYEYTFILFFYSNDAGQKLSNSSFHPSKFIVYFRLGTWYQVLLHFAFTTLREFFRSCYHQIRDYVIYRTASSNSVTVYDPPLYICIGLMDSSKYGKNFETEIIFGIYTDA